MTAMLIDRVREYLLCESSDQSIWIKQDVLAANLGVSKIPIREALTRLEREGLVTSEANRGFFTTPLSAEELDEIFLLRMKLEPEAVALATKKADSAARQHAEEMLDQLQHEISTGGRHVGALNRRFHMALVSPAARPITSEILERLYMRAERYVRKHLEDIDRPARANEEHSDLLKAWVSGDGKRVKVLISSHIRGTLNDLRRQLGRSRRLPTDVTDI